MGCLFGIGRDLFNVVHGAIDECQNVLKMLNPANPVLLMKYRCYSESLSIRNSLSSTLQKGYNRINLL